MALDYSLHPNAAGSPRRSVSLPELPILGGQIGLAIATNSAVITGPCELCITSAEKVRLDVKAEADAGDLDPAASPLVIPAGSPSWFFLPAGSWVLKTAAA